LVLSGLAAGCSSSKPAYCTDAANVKTSVSKPRQCRRRQERSQLTAVAGWFGRFPARVESREDTYLLDPELIPVLGRRAAGWFLDNGRPEEALEYSMAAGDADTAACLVHKLWLAPDRQGRIATFRRWLTRRGDRLG
jgi:hypothetical protein